MKLHASILYPGATIYMVQEKPLFPNSSLTKADICAIKVADVGFGPNGDESKRVINKGAHEVTTAGNPNPGINDIVYDEETARDIWGASMEKGLKEAKINLANAKKELEAMENYKKMVETTLKKGDLGFDKPAKRKELIIKED